jgi:hypothetical protein
MEEIDIGVDAGALYHCQRCGRLLTVGLQGQQGWIEHDQVEPRGRNGIMFELHVAATIDIVAPDIDAVKEYMYKNVCVMDGDRKMDAFDEDVTFEIMPK